MKRTNRDKDWAFVTALGVRMIEAEDDRGWLHIYDPEALQEAIENNQCPEAMLVKRPALALALNQALVAGGVIPETAVAWLPDFAPYFEAR